MLILGILSLSHFVTKKRRGVSNPAHLLQTENNVKFWQNKDVTKMLILLGERLHRLHQRCFCRRISEAWMGPTYQNMQKFEPILKIKLKITKKIMFSNLPAIC